MTLVKTSILSFIATAVKLLAGLVINKAVAVYIGPSGLALIGQFQNFMQLVMTVAQGAINSGVTKYTAEYGKDDTHLPVLFSTAGRISFVSSICVGLMIMLFSHDASLHFLKSDRYQYIFIILGVTIVLFVMNGLLLSILNGLKEIKTWVVINIVQSLYSLVFTTVLIVFLGLDGALIALVTNQSVIFFVVLWMLRKHPIMKWESFKGKFSQPEAKKLMGFALMAITAAIATPFSQLLVRNYIGEHLSWEQAGYWQGIWYISTMYLMVVTTTLSIYYLPRLSEITDKISLHQEVLNGYKLIIPLVMILAFVIYILRDMIITVLFTDKFSPMADLFLLQLIGDVIKLSCFLIGYVLIAKAMTKIFIIKELLVALSFVFISCYMIDIMGLKGVLWGYIISYGLNFIFLIIVYRKYVQSKITYV